ncbi:integrase family protein, partial [bacterium]|nr:integrase family protein [bacterium]
MVSRLSRPSSKKLTKSFVDSIPLTESGQTFYRDTEISGFGLRVGTTSKTYIAEGKANGKTVRMTIGRHGVFTAEQARVEARQILVMIAKGVNPVDEKKERRAKAVTMGQAFEDYLTVRKALKPRTIYDYRRFMKTYLADWADKPISAISKDMIAKRHAKMGETSAAQANLTMRFVRALFNFAAGQYEDSKGQSLVIENPVKRLSQTRAWYRVERKQTLIKPHELAPWYEAIMSLQNDSRVRTRESVRDYLLLVLFTGLRKEEAAKLTWNNVDLKARTLTVLDTKNHLDHTLPLSDFLYELLLRRKEAATNNSVFPGEGASGHMVEPRKQMAKVIQESGVHFTIHDLRRTFITVAESLDISAYALKRLLNHK